MTAKQEIQKWLKQHRQLNSETDGEQFFQNLFETLGSKNADQHHEGVLALGAAVHATRLQAEKAKNLKKVGLLLVFPKSPEEQELLQKLLEQMAIPFKMNT